MRLDESVARLDESVAWPLEKLVWSRLAMACSTSAALSGGGGDDVNEGTVELKLVSFSDVVIEDDGNDTKDCDAGDTILPSVDSEEHCGKYSKFTTRQDILPIVWRKFIYWEKTLRSSE